MDQLLLPYEFYGSDVRGIYFFIYASCEPLKHWNLQASTFQEFWVLKK